MEIPKNLGSDLKLGFFSAGGGAIAAVIALFATGFITWTSSAEEMAAESAEQAVTEALVPVCVANFKAASGALAVKLAALEEESSWQRDDYVVKQGWATMPGATEPNSSIADTCARELMKLAKQ